MDVFYLKYRPKNIDELDLISVRERLSKIVKQGSLPHSFLFSGPKGTGKTSAARILAKFLNCSNLKGYKSCGKCETCLEIDRGEGLDVVEIDAASNRGIDDIRELKEKISFQPLRTKNKVYIVDEVHMLTREAFNAFLKTLEEPPNHAYFIFCTTNPEKIPATILSRLTIIEFSKGSIDEISNCLKRVAKGEKIKIDEKSLEMISKISDGSFRDAHKIFYQLWTESEGKISLDKTQKFLGYFQELEPEKLLEMMAKNKLRESLDLAEKLEKKGVDFEDYLKKTAQILKNMLLAKFGVKENYGPEVVSLAGLFTEKDIIILSRLVITANLEQKTAVVPQLPLEMMVVSFLQKNSANNSGEKKIDSKPLKEPKPTKEEDKSISKSVENGKEKQPKKEVVDVVGIVANWDKVLEAVKPMNHSVGALLRACRPAGIEDNCLVLEVFYPFHKDRLSDMRNRRIVEDGLKTVFGHDWRLRCVLAEKPAESIEKLDRSKISSKPKTEDELYDIAKDIFGE
jgi:DNA polymerase III subunit gamma/tau